MKRYWSARPLLFFTAFISCSLPAWGQHQLQPITLFVDASEASKRILHAHEVIPAKPGLLTLYYPKWIPHTPSGPINDLAGLKFSALGRTLAWRRDGVDMFAFHLVVPPEADSVDVSLDCLSHRFPPTSADIIVINWDTLLLYPEGWTAKQLTVSASLRLPPKWKFGTALPVANQSETNIGFQPTSLYTITDSPVIAGRYFRVFPLGEGSPLHEIDIAADSAAALEVNGEVITHYKHLTTQAFALFGARHYRAYHFLLGLSDLQPASGMEHHESNESHLAEGGLTNPDELIVHAALLAHEFAHSWDGKYRRPSDLYTQNYQQPMRTDLLWVYEGLTQYLGNLLAARSGLWTDAQYRDSLALIAADLDHRAGRTWRDLQDTADATPILYGVAPQWESWRRTASDFYDESLLIWLEAEVRIRQETQGRRSLDDFCRLFFGPPSGPPEVKTYTFDDVVNALNQIAPNDWGTFFTERLTSLAPSAPLGGIEGGGWRVVYNNIQSELLQAQERLEKTVNAAYSIGLVLKQNGTVIDSIFGMPAVQAGIMPGMQVLAVNGRHFTPDILRNALKAEERTSQPMELFVRNAECYETYRLDYHGGEKYPHLERDPIKPDLLEQILKPLPTNDYEKEQVEFTPTGLPRANSTKEMRWDCRLLD
jgi:predicted metalloprotease with PDZ domain